MKNFADLQEMEQRKRRIKGAGEIETKGVDLANNLFDDLPAAARKSLAAKLECDAEEVANRDVMSAAVASHLPQVVKLLLDAGLAKTDKEKQRPRKFDAEAWRCLVRAAELVDAPKVALLRAALTLLIAKGVTEVDLPKCLKRLDSLASRS